MTVKMLHGDVREVVPALADRSINCVLTSPPYWGLRSYLPADHPMKHLEIGSEATVQEWLATMVRVFELIRPKLADDGTMFVNVGDSYAGSRSGPQGEKSTLAGNGHQGGGPKRRTVQRQMTASARRDDHPIPRSDMRMDGIKPKDMVGQPWLLAFALRDAGWYLRQCIVWAKKNPMPESARDRFTKSHEFVFLLTKKPRYFWDFDAVAEPCSGGTHARIPGNRSHKGVDAAALDDHHRTKAGLIAYAERQRAKYKTPDGWDTSKGKGGHGAFHKNGREKGKVLAEGSYGDGKSDRLGREPGWRKLAEADSGTKNNGSFDEAMAVMPQLRNPRDVFRGLDDEWEQFLAWKAMMACEPVAPDVIDIASEPYKEAHFATFPQALIEPCIKAGCPPGGVVLDPFGGSGTTARVCERLHRDAVLIDIDERNGPMVEGRLRNVQKELLLGGSA